MQVCGKQAVLSRVFMGHFPKTHVYVGARCISRDSENGPLYEHVPHVNMRSGWQTTPWNLLGWLREVLQLLSFSAAIRDSALRNVLHVLHVHHAGL